MRRASILAVAAASLLPAVAPGRPAQTVMVAVRDPVIRPAAAGQPTTAAYMTLVNATARPLRLIDVDCGCAGMVSPHESKSVGGVMQMRAAGAVVVPARGAVRFQPGGLHLMVMDLKRPIRAGDHVPMRLTFDRGAAMTVSFLAAR